METRKPTDKPVQVPIGASREGQREGRESPVSRREGRESPVSRRSTESTYERREGAGLGKEGKEGKHEGGTGEFRLTRTLRPLGITSIRNVEITNRQYISSGVSMYVKNREGQYENTDVSNFLNNADLKLTFTLPMDVNPDDLAFCHQKSACPIINPLLHCQCTINVGLIENVTEMLKEKELCHGSRACKTYVIELPLVRGLSLEPFNTLYYTIRIAGLKMPEQTELFWRLHLKVCQAEDVLEVVSVSDHPFDVNVLQDNLNTFTDRFNDMFVRPIKRRGWFNWGKRSSGQCERHPTPFAGEAPKQQYQQPVYPPTTGGERPKGEGETASHRV